MELFFIGGPLGTGFRTVNFEAQDRYEVTIDVADGSGGSSIVYTLNVTDQNDNAPLFTSPDHIYVGADADPNVVVYRATATDRDTVTNIDAATGNVIADTAAPGDQSVLGDALKYDRAAYNSDPVTGNNNNLFDLNQLTIGNNGEVKFGGTGGTPAPGTYKLELTASDGKQTTSKFVSLTVTAGALPPAAFFTSGNDTVNLNDFTLAAFSLASTTDALQVMIRLL